MTFSIDFHSHSFWSDGDISPEELVGRAKHKSINFLALTDHATIGGIESFSNACKKAGIKTVIGAELTCVHKSIWFDVLIFGFNAKDSQITDCLKKDQLILKNVCQRYMSWLEKNKFSISWEEVLGYYKIPSETTPSLYFINKYRREVFSHNQTDIGQDIREAGARQIDRADFYLNGGPTLEEVLNAARHNNALVSLAHPIKTSDTLSRIKKISAERCLVELLEIVEECKIEAIEIRHPTHNSLDEQKLLLFCNKNNLIVTGGSDYHGDKRGEHKESVHFGDYGLTEGEFKKIQERLNLIEPLKI